MSSHNASKETGLPPNTSTRAQQPDVRLGNPKQVSQETRLSLLKKKGNKKFDKVGQIGPV